MQDRVLDAQALDGGAHRVRVARRAGSPGVCTEMTRSPCVGVARVPRLR